MIKPKTRKEKLLSAIANDTPVTIQPKNREELFLAQIAEKTGNVPKPLTYDYMPEGYPKKEVVDVITWDGNTEGLVNVSGVIFKVSDIVLTRADIIKARLKITSISDGTVEETEVGDENILDYGDVLAVTDAVMVAQKDNVTSSGVTFPEAGVYFMCSPGNKYVSEFSGFETSFVTPMSEEFLPESVKGGASTEAIVNISFTLGDSGAPVYSADKTFSEIHSIITSGTHLRALFVSADNVTWLEPGQATAEQAIFYTFVEDGVNSFDLFVIKVTADNTVTGILQ